MADYDAIVIGAGHNGLAAASVLARNGLSVLCVEKNHWVGGMAATRTLFEGYKHNVGAWALLIFRDAMIKRLGLENYGLELIRPRTSYCVFGDPEDTLFIGYTDQEELALHLMEKHGEDAVEGLALLGDWLERFRTLIEKELFQPPSSIESLIAKEPDAETREIYMKMFYGSAMDLLRHFFPDPKKHNCILGSLTASAIDGTHTGPFSSGNAFSLGYHLAFGDEYDFRTPKGGIGALSEALLRSMEDHGGKLLFKTKVKDCLIKNGTIEGVVLDGGETVTAKVVLSSLDAKTTFLGMAGEENLPSDVVHKVKEIKYKNGYIQLQMTLKELPEFTGYLAFANDDNIRWLMAYIRSPEHLSECWKQYIKGEIPDDPVSYCTVTSLLDPSLSPEGSYTCTIFSHYFPYNIPKGKHREYSNVMADRVIGQINKYAPNFKRSIEHKAVLTHRYFENVFSITAGDFCHGLIHPEYMWDKRPVAGWAGYKTPIDSLYMCGSACHPGPGVTCIPGYNSANEVLKNI